MADERDQRLWAARDARVERAGLAEWQRAQVRESAKARDPLADVLGELGGSEAAAALLLQFMLHCLPPKAYGDARRFKSGYYRMVAFLWRLAPELLDGCRQDKDVAERLGISHPAFCKHLATVDAILAPSGPARPERRAPRA